VSLTLGLGSLLHQFCPQPRTQGRGLLVQPAHHSKTCSKTVSSANRRWYRYSCEIT